MHPFKRVLTIAGLAVLVAVVWFTYQVTHPPSLQPYADRWLAPADTQTTGLRVTHLGVSTLLIDDGETAILTDGFFSRPNKSTVLFGKIAPDPEVIAKSLQRAGIQRLAAVIVVHSHFDHVMDAPEVAKRTGALVVGSESTANVARGWGLPNDRIRVVRDGDTLTLGRFVVTMIASQHVPAAMVGGEIGEPLVPPVRFNKYEEGGSYSVLVGHGKKTLLVQGSAGFVPGALRGRRADVVFLGIGLLGKQDDVYRQTYWREVVASVGARRVIPIHWDDFFIPLDQPAVPLPRPFDDFDSSMAFVSERGRESGVDVKLAPVGVKIDPWAGL